MPQKITMPDAGQTTDQLVVTRWLKQVGDPVARGDVLLEIETDKATVTVESFAEGTLLERLVEEGGTASAGDVIALVGRPDEQAGKAAPAPAPAADKASVPVSSGPTSPFVPPTPAQRNGNGAPVLAGRVRASPAAKKAARELGVDLLEVARSSGKPTLRRADVEAFRDASQANRAAAPRTAEAPRPQGGAELVPLSRMRQAIAARMVQSATTIPAFTVEVEVDMTDCQRVRGELNTRAGDGVRIAYHDLLARCVAVAAVKHPLVNASYGPDGVAVHRAVHVGLAVSLPEGLVVPVVRDAGSMGLAALAQASAAAIQAARAGSLRADLLEGGTITISNLGMFPVRRFTAIVNPPQSCILAVGEIATRPLWLDGSWQPRPFMSITGSFDHRVVDGAYGAAFLREVKDLLEHPTMLLL